MLKSSLCKIKTMLPTGRSKSSELHIDVQQ